MIDTPLDRAVASLLASSPLTLSLAESCSGGLIAKRITDIPGSSRYFLEGVVTYSNSSKIRLLGVSPELLEIFGAVSPECAAAMAAGVRQNSGSDIGLAVTGIAGPDGGSIEKPVGTVFISISTAEEVQTEHCMFSGARDVVRAMTAERALEMLHEYLSLKAVASLHLSAP